MAKRDQWRSRAGFLAAAVGSAVGLGNMWRFSYLTAEQGGAAFVALYLLFTVGIGLPVLLAELAVGRGAGTSPVLALKHFGSRRWSVLGWFFVATGFLILAYYSVIAGWTLRYGIESIFLAMPEDPGSRFAEISQGGDAFAYHILFMALVMWIVVGGVSRGIERVAMVAMPLLFILVCAIALYAATLPGASAGYAYYLNTDFSNAFSMEVLISAAGQAFFSLSLGMGAMITFASYLPARSDLPSESVWIGGMDFAVAFVAGLMVFPIIFALGLQADVGESTLGALFVALPKAFSAMGAAGHIIGPMFFAALVVGALTSAISLLEVVVAAAVDGLGWSRTRAVWVGGLAIALMGSAAAWNIGILDLMDQVANNLFLLAGGLALAVFVGWFMDDPIGEARSGSDLSPGLLRVWRELLRFAVPVVLLIVLWYSVPATLKNLWAFFSPS